LLAIGKHNDFHLIITSSKTWIGKGQNHIILAMTEKCVYCYPSPSVLPIAIFLNNFIDLTKVLEQNAIALLRVVALLF
jgi:hypothetical protein